MFNCLAADIGAGGGRVIRGTFDRDRLTISAIHRFANEERFVAGHYRWGIDGIFAALCQGLHAAGAEPPTPASIGVDTWGVDFILLGEAGGLLEEPVTYRDPRTDGAMERFFEVVGKEEIYRKTGIQFLQINTLYQLYAMRLLGSPLLEKAKTFLMIPDYLNYRLTGQRAAEFTIATTTQLLHVDSGTWDTDLIDALGLDRSIFLPPVRPATPIGPLAPEVRNRTSLPAVPVIAPATHDTGSAVAAVPAEGHGWAFISSGTWCLVGVEVGRPVCTERARELNFTNEGGVSGTYRLLKNVSGLWILRGLKESLGGGLSYEELATGAQRARPFGALIDANDPCFLHPGSMKDEIDRYCRATGQPLPGSPGAYARCALESLALLFDRVIQELRLIQDREIDRIHIVGGGCQDRLLCQMTADVTGLPTYAGPVEGAAIGNLLVQAMGLGRIASLEEGRRLVASSFAIREYQPESTHAWQEARERFRIIREMSHAERF